MKKIKTPKYFVEALWKDGALEYTDFCYSERYMITCIKRALADGYTVKVKGANNETIHS